MEKYLPNYHDLLIKETLKIPQFKHLVEKYPIDKLTSKLKIKLIKEIKYIIQSTAKAADTCINLLDLGKSLELNYCSIESPRASDYAPFISKSEVKGFMSKSITEECDLNGDVVILLNTNYFHIADVLLEKNINVKEYFVTSKILNDDPKNYGDLCLRNPGYDHPYCRGSEINGLVIDLHKNPDQDSVEMIVNDLNLSDIHEL